MSKWCPLACCALLISSACLGPVGTARAGVFGDVLVGLDYAGFQYVGERNPLSGGATIGMSRVFNNTLLDFGTTDLTLTGPVAASFTTGGR